MFDLDSTLVHNPTVIETLTEMLPYTEVYDIVHNLTGKWYEESIIPDDVRAVMDEKHGDGLYMTSLKPNPYAVSILNDLRLQGHNIFVITARGREEGEVKEVTPDFVKELFPMINGIALTGHNKNKAIKKLNIDVVVEDSTMVVDTILDDSELNPLIILLSNENTPWNWNYNADEGNIIVLDSLLDIPFIVEDYKTI